MARIISSFVLLLVLLLVVGIAVLNPSQRVELNLFFGTYYDVPLVLALFLAFLIGCVLTFLYLLVHSVRLRWQIRELKSRNRQYEQEITAIRNIPVDEDGGEEGETFSAEEEK